MNKHTTSNNNEGLSLNKPPPSLNVPIYKHDPRVQKMYSEVLRALLVRGLLM